MEKKKKKKRRNRQKKSKRKWRAAVSWRLAAVDAYARLADRGPHAGLGLARAKLAVASKSRCCIIVACAHSDNYLGTILNHQIRQTLGPASPFRH